MTTTNLNARVVEVLGDGPFCEIGLPRVADFGADGLVAIGGDLGSPQWAGFDAQQSAQGARWHRVGVYVRRTLECRCVVALHWPVHGLAFSPDGTYLAIATGSYDGGFLFEGELVLVDVNTGLAVSVLEDNREVLAVAWQENGALHAVLSPPDEEDPPELTAVAIGPEAWSPFGERRVPVSQCMVGVAEQPPEPASAIPVVQDLARAAGAEWVLRRQVWAVEQWDDNVFASLEGVELESWDSDGDLRFRRATNGRGCQIVADGAVVVTNVEPPWGPPETGFRRSASVVQRIDPSSGEVASVVPADAPSVVFRDEAGWLLVRNCAWESGVAKESKLFAPGSNEPETIALGGYDLFNHYVWVRGAPDLLIAEGDIDRPWANKWLVRLEPASRRPRWGRSRPEHSRTPLYALEWDHARSAQIMGGPSAFVADGMGESIVHSGWIHSPRGLVAGSAFIVRRSYPKGAVQWEQRHDSQAVGVAHADGVVFAAFISGELLAFDAANGEVVHRSEVAVNGHAVVPLSLACQGPRCVIVGTLDGRVLRMELHSAAEAEDSSS